MAKGQKRSNKEVRKPKQEKAAKQASPSSITGSATPLKPLSLSGKK